MPDSKLHSLSQTLWSIFHSKRLRNLNYFILLYSFIFCHKYLIWRYSLQHAAPLLWNKQKFMKVWWKSFSQLSTFEHEREFEFIFWAFSRRQRLAEQEWKVFFFWFYEKEFIMCDVHDLLLVSCWKMRVLKQILTAWQNVLNALCESFVPEIYCV